MSLVETRREALLYSQLHSVALYQEQATGSGQGRSRAARSQQQQRQSQPNKLPSMTSGGPCETTSLRPSPRTKPSCVFFGDTASPTNHNFTLPADRNWQPDQKLSTVNSSERPVRVLQRGTCHLRDFSRAHRPPTAIRPSSAFFTPLPPPSQQVTDSARL